MRRHVDYPLLALTLALLAAGLLVISSASVVVSQRNFDTPYYYLLRQSGAAVVGLIVLWATKSLPYHWWRRLALPLLGLSLLAMAAVFIPDLSFRFGGAARWLDLGPLSLQPSELMKFSLILYLAAWLDRTKTRSRGFATAFVPFLFIIGVVAVLLTLQPDIGTLIVTAGAAVALYFLGGGRVSQLAAFGVLAAGGLAAVVAQAPYRLARFAAFLNPAGDPQGIGYHINQALIAIGSGGFAGRGFGQSIQKFNYLPEPTGDSIFAVIGEEFGLAGAVMLIALYVAFFLRAIVIARRAPDFFGKLVVAGFASLILIQAFVNMAAITGLLPLTGVPLPFISYGGTALVVTLAMAGVMLNVSRRV